MRPGPTVWVLELVRLLFERSGEIPAGFGRVEFVELVEFEEVKLPMVEFENVEFVEFVEFVGCATATESCSTMTSATRNIAASPRPSVLLAIIPSPVAAKTALAISLS